MKKTIAIIMTLVMVFSLTGCISVEYVPQQTTQSQPSQSYTPQTPSQSAQSQSQEQPSSQMEIAPHEGDYKWAFYWYLCGSNLESDGACATYDLMELTKVSLPEDIVFVILTGGAKTWRNNSMDSRKLQTWVYDDQGLYQVAEQNRADMGDAETLGAFLEFCRDNYSAEKEAVLFWNHGGGSVSGAAFDENYNYDSLTLNEMYAACGSVFGTDTENQPLELVGFDTCLMATIDVAYTFYELAHYLVASEESEPGNGWYYTQWVQALVNNPDMDGAQLGKEICDAFVTGCKMDRTQDSITLSTVDLRKIEPLLDAYESFGAEALASAAQNTAFISAFGRAAKNSENYGGNTPSQGYTNMVDLGSLAANAEMKTSKQVIDALNDCVVYKVNGRYKSQSSGLSCYYSYNGDRKDYSKYANPDICLTPSDGFKYFYEYQVTGNLGSDGRDYLTELMQTGQAPSSAKPDQVQQVQTIDDTKWDGIKVQLNKKTGTSYIDLGKTADDILSAVCFELFYLPENSDLMVLMGYDNDLQADWNNGIFADNFRGVWGAIDGTPVYMELSNIYEEYNIYSVPILLNGAQYNMQIAYSFTDEEWYVLGARKGLDTATGMAAKELRQLEVGDEVTIVWKLASNSADTDFEYYTVDTITVTADTSFAEAELGGGKYAMVYEMTDASGNTAVSEPVYFEIIDGEIYTTVEN